MTSVLEYRFTCPLPNGLHARPANRFEQVVSAFESDVSVENLRTQKVANVKSVLSLVSADIKNGDECLVRIDGQDRDKAYQNVIRFLEDEFPHCDDVLPELYEQEEGYLPPAIKAAGISVARGLAVVPGIGRGRVVKLQGLTLPACAAEMSFAGIDQEVHDVRKAIGDHRDHLYFSLKGKVTPTEKAILETHLSITQDVELINVIESTIRKNEITSGEAILKAFHHFSTIFQAAESELIRERILDLQDVCSALLKSIYGTETKSITLEDVSICVADNITPSQFISLDKQKVAGLVLLHGGKTSHTVILARSYGIPTLTGVTNLDRLITDGQDVIVDANYGLLLPEINQHVERFYEIKRQEDNYEEQTLAMYKKRLAYSRDGVRLEVMANVATAQEVSLAIENGAEGIGLFRTEMLFMDRDSAPTEEEQFKEYKAAAMAADGKPVIIRTFDIGGDKPVSYLNLTAEENPFLGNRGVRLYWDHTDLFRTQLKALLRASVFGDIRIMIPMVSSLDELEFVSKLLGETKTELEALSVDFNDDVKLGVMVEVPSLGFIIGQLAGFIDFISIGTNDLTQYFLAADRGNDKVNNLYQNCHPGMVAFIRKIVDDAHAHNLWVGMCGEMAGNVHNTPALLGTGIDELSVAIPSILPIKSSLSELDKPAASTLLEDAIQCSTSTQVEALFKNYSPAMQDKSIIDIALVDLSADCLNKEEVILKAVNALNRDRRVIDKVELENDFWRREEVYSTGLGFGIAIPHCKSSFVRTNSICVFRLNEPVEWGSLDEKPVDVVIAMTIRDVDNAGDTHMKIFSKLARNIIHEEFRDTLRAINSPEEIVTFLHQSLDIN